MQSWGCRSRFDNRDTAMEPTRSGVFGLLAAALGVPREDWATPARWDESLRFGVRVDRPRGRSGASGFRLATDYQTAQSVLRASGKGLAGTVLSRRHYLADARFTVGLESRDLELLRAMEAGLKNPVWPLSLGRKSFPLALPPWLPGGGIRTETGIWDALRTAPFLLLSGHEALPDEIAFAVEPPPNAATLTQHWEQVAYGAPFDVETDREGLGSDVVSRRHDVSVRTGRHLKEDEFVAEARPEYGADGVAAWLQDRPQDFGARRFGVRRTLLFRRSRAECGMEADPCFYPE
jgi:CRISPR system Cascade subunit CasD